MSEAQPSSIWRGKYVGGISEAAGDKELIPATCTVAIKEMVALTLVSFHCQQKMVAVVQSLV